MSRNGCNRLFHVEIGQLGDLVRLLGQNRFARRLVPQKEARNGGERGGQEQHDEDDPETADAVVIDAQDHAENT